MVLSNGEHEAQSPLPKVCRQGHVNNHSYVRHIQNVKSIKIDCRVSQSEHVVPKVYSRVYHKTINCSTNLGELPVASFVPEEAPTI